MRVFSLLGIGLFLLSLSSFASAWGYVADTWNTNQIYGGSYFVPSSYYSGWTYNAYLPNSGYPVMGGGRMYPYGYLAGSYVAPMAYGYPSYWYGSGYGYGYGVPVHTTLDYYNRGFSLYYSSPRFSVGCTLYSC